MFLVYSNYYNVLPSYYIKKNKNQIYYLVGPQTGKPIFTVVQ